jgi:hypothetical protein
MLRGAASDGLTRAEELFVKALDLAHAQGALGWQLRAATSLASLRHQAGRTDEARKLLRVALTAIKQDHDSRDMVKARELQSRLG